MTRKAAYRKFRVALRDPARLGDAAMYKAHILGIPTHPGLARELLALGELPRVDVDALRELPRGTLGREYVEFMASRDLHPFVVGPRLEREVLELLSLPLERWWARPVAELRAELHIDAADELA